MDIESIPIGGSVRQRISNAIDSAAVVLVLIGPDWSLERLSNSEDWVRIEIASALEKQVPIIPIRLQRAEMPEASQLPEELAGLVDANAGDIEHSSWRRDLPPIVDAIRRELSDADHQSERDEPESTTGDRRTNVSRRVALVATVATSCAVLAVLLVVAFADSSQDSPAANAPSSGMSIATVDPSSPTATRSEGDESVSTIDVALSASPPAASSVPVMDLIPISLDGPLVEVQSPAVLTDTGTVVFPQPEEGHVTIEFTPKTSDDYVVWARVQIPADIANPVDGNSLYVVQGANLPRSNEFVWDFWEGGAFPRPGVSDWDRISRRGATGDFLNHTDNPFVVIGRPGQTVVVTLGGREEGVTLERLYVTNDRTWSPPECAESEACSTRLTDRASASE